MNKLKLSVARDRLIKAVTALDSAHKRTTNLEQGRSAVVAELAELEAKVEHHPGDETATARLLLLREQKEHFDARITRLFSDTEREAEDRLKVEMEDALQAAVGSIVEAGRPELERLTKSATAALAGFYLPGATLELAVQRCDAVRSLKAFLVNGGNGYDKLGSVQRVLESLLSSGTLPWTWPPATVAKAQAEPLVAHA